MKKREEAKLEGDRVAQDGFSRDGAETTCTPKFTDVIDAMKSGQGRTADIPAVDTTILAVAVPMADASRHHHWLPKVSSAATGWKPYEVVPVGTRGITFSDILDPTEVRLCGEGECETKRECDR